MGTPFSVLVEAVEVREPFDDGVIEVARVELAVVVDVRDAIEDLLMKAASAAVELTIAELDVAALAYGAGERLAVTGFL